MALFCAYTKSDSISLLKFSFGIHVQVFFCAISLVCLLKYPRSYFSSYFYFIVFIVFLFVLMLAIVISFSLTIFNVVLEDYIKNNKKN